MAKGKDVQSPTLKRNRSRCRLDLGEAMCSSAIDSHGTHVRQGARCGPLRFFLSFTFLLPFLAIPSEKRDMMMLGSSSSMVNPGTLFHILRITWSSVLFSMCQDKKCVGKPRK